MLLRLVRIGWSNLWRNPRRTALTVLALALGTVTLAVTISLMKGMTRDLIERGTSLLLGHIEIHHADYRPDRSIFDTVPGDGRALAARLAGVDGVEAAAPRAASYGLVSAGEQSAGAELLGVVPSLEAGVSTLLDRVETGRTLRDGDVKKVLVGHRLARTLGVAPGDELVVLTQAADGSLGNDLYQLVGVFKTGVDGLDGGLLVLLLDDVQELLALPPERVHEIALRTTDAASAPAVAARLRAALDPPLDVAAWPTLAPEIASYVAMSDGWLWLLYLIVLTLAVIAVLNTMLMAVFERFREFGVLSAIGMRPVQIVLLVVVEVGALAVVSLVATVALGTPVLYWLVHTGIDLRSITEGFTLSGVAIDPILRGAWATREFAVSAFLLIAFALGSGLYPALRAARVNPAQLTRGEIR
jgi:ABC-type lipoprotein release transport system permease subunit